MSKIILIIPLLIFMSCKKEHKELLGVWNVDSKYYNATYKVHEEEGDLVAQALYYDDGTTQYKLDTNPDKKMYLFKNLIKKEEVFVDAVAGETKTNKSNLSKIKLVDKDTLEVTTYIMSRPLKEKWIRKSNNPNK